MVEVEVETRKIGGSIGIILPNDLVKSQRIKVKDKIRIDVKKPMITDDFFGVTEWKKSTDEIMKEIKKGWK